MLAGQKDMKLKKYGHESGHSNDSKTKKSKNFRSKQKQNISRSQQKSIQSKVNKKKTKKHLRDQD